jgi:hypothetical protein
MIYGLKVLKEDIQYNIDKYYRDTVYSNTYLCIQLNLKDYQIQICADLFDKDTYTIFLKRWYEQTCSKKPSFFTAGYVVKDLTSKTVHNFHYDMFGTNETSKILEKIDKTTCPYHNLVKKFYWQVNLINTFHTGI